jgi:hypothetical protein
MISGMKTDPLKSHRDEVATAEAALIQSRINLRAAAERKGLPTAGLFSETEFVPRSTAERWERAAERKGRDGMVDILMAVANPNSPFAHFAGVDLSGPALVVNNRPADAATADAIIAAGKKRRGEA